MNPNTRRFFNAVGIVAFLGLFFGLVYPVSSSITTTGQTLSPGILPSGQPLQITGWLPPSRERAARGLCARLRALTLAAWMHR